jgi:hypothetical protein
MYITDPQGNRANIAYWGSEEKARASLTTLTRCTDCTDCTRCTDSTGCTRCTDSTGCTGCTRCTDSTGCTRCTGCTGCMGCTDCDLDKPYHRLPVSDPRGYTWLAIAEMGSWHIHAGCRDFTIAEARAHWLGSDYGGPDDVRETVGHALDWIAGKPAA